MSCERCGSRTTTGSSLCRACQRDENRDDDAPSGFETYPCPTCDGPTSGEGVECYKCRSDSDDANDASGREVATDGGIQ